MAVFAVGLAGAAIGSTFGMASLGFSVGIMLGNMLFAKDTRLPDVEGPRLADLRVQSSAYGQMIPMVYGTVRIAGNVIWSSNIKESKQVTTTSTRSKGGKKVKQTHTTYTYSVSLAVSLCEGPIGGIRRIWANGALIYDVGSAASVEALIASSRAARDITVYQGTESQNPDPLMQSFEGSGNVPAYRGQAYVVLRDFQLADYGNTIPNFTFEVVSTEPEIMERTLDLLDTGGSFPYPTRIGQMSSVHLMDRFRFWGVDTNLFGNTMCLFEFTGGRSYPLMQVPLNVPGGLAAQITETKMSADEPLALVQEHTSGYEGGYQRRWRLYFEDGSYRKLGTVSAWSYDAIVSTNREVVGVTYKLIAFVPHIEISRWGGADTPAHLVTIPLADISSATLGGVGFTSSFIYVAVSFFVGPGRHVRLLKVSKASLSVVSSWTFSEPVHDTSGANHGVRVYCVNDSEIYLWTPNGGGGAVWRFDGTTIAEYPNIPGGGASSSAHGTHFFIVRGNQGLFLYREGLGSNFPRPGGRLRTYGHGFGSSSLSTTVSDICGRAGLGLSDINTSDLTDTVSGYVITRQGSARSALEPLQQAFQFDGAEIDNQIRFVKRGKAPVVTITEDDLGAYEAGADAADVLPTNRIDDIQLPVSVDVLYISRAANYQQGVQQAKRITDSQNALAVELPIVLTANQAKQLADRLLYEAWISRSTHLLATYKKFAWLTPTDVVSVSAAGSTRRVRLDRVDVNPYGVVQLQCISDDAPVYEQETEGEETPVNDDPLELPGPCLPVFLDIPLLRDQDDDPGFYTGLLAFRDSWRGAALFSSVDDGATYGELFSAFLSLTVGRAEGVLGVFSGGNVFDETNTLTVVLYRGELSGATDLSVLAGENAALVGDELVFFRDAELIGQDEVGQDRYLLSGLLRGRQGTEWAMSTHVAGERFVLLTPDTVRRVVAQLSDVGLERVYKAVNFGETLQENVPHRFANTAQGLRPLSPVHLGGGRSPSGDVSITWVRRTRVGGGWTDGSDVPLGEQAAAYEVEIWNSAFTVLQRTLESDTTSVTYTAADQVTDFGSQQSTVYVRVYQLSASVGHGRPLQGSI